MISIALALILLQGAPQPGTVTGQIRTVDGAPAIAIRVAAMPVPTSNAKPEDGVQYFTYPPPEASTLTDTQGHYTLRNLTPGRYYIMAGSFGVPVYYPGVDTMERATAVTMGPASAGANLDFKIPKLRGGTISGRVNTANRDPQLKVTLLGGKLEELLDATIEQDGTFRFGHVPPGSYLVGLFPRPPGFSSVVVPINDKDASGLVLSPPPTHTVTGRIVVDNGPLPHALLAFSTPQSYVDAQVKPDGTFTTKLHAARHRVDLAGMPVGYSVSSVRIGSQDATEGFAISNADVSNVVINVSAPRRLPKIHGSVAGLAAAQLASTKVEVTGEINGSLQAAIQQDGSFEFPAVIPGLYKLRLTGVSGFPAMNVVVAGWDTTEVKVVVPAR